MTLLITYHSIVAVPGLGTKAEMTFRSKTRNDIWLRDYLPRYIEEARVLLYGYNSQVPNSRSTATYGEMASVLLKSLCRIRYETNVSCENSIALRGIRF